MKIKEWMVIASAFAVAGSGTGFLAKAMSNAQKTVVEKATVVTKEADAVKNTADSEAKSVSKTTNNDTKAPKPKNYPIDFPIKEAGGKGFVNRTKAELSIKDAVRYGIDAIEKIYGTIKVKDVLDLLICESAPPEPYMSIRYYEGFIRCKGGDVGYEFKVNSITGEAISVEKITNQNSVGDWTEQDVYDQKEKFQKMAKQLIEKTLKYGKVNENEEMLIDIGHYSGEDYGFNWDRYLACVCVKTEDGLSHQVSFDPANYEIIEWQCLIDFIGVGVGV